MHELQAHISEVCQRLFADAADVELQIPEKEFGDFTTNIAMQLAGRLQKNPRDIAGAIVNELNHPAVASAEIAGPGFINIRLTDEALVSSIETEPTQATLQKNTVVIETNNPNPFKAMHIGHAYNAIIADGIANILERAQAQVHRVSYHGDVGAHVGKSMYSLLRYVGGNPAKLDEIPASERNSFMSKMYAEGANAYKENETAKAEIDALAQQSFVLDDPVYKQVYETCKAWSFADIDTLVERLGNQPVEKRYLESEADKLGVETVQANVGTVFVESEGALIFPGEKYGVFDNAFVSSKGRGLYGARDLGLIQLKAQDFHPDKSYIVTAHEQKDYFRGVLKAAELCFPEQKDVTINISTGTVTLSTGKMSSRTGDVIEVRWLFDQIESALTEQGGSATEAVVRGAIRYQFLRHRVSSDIVFDVNESINTHGNSGPYLQYAHARARSILAKSKLLAGASNFAQLTDSERELLRKISHYPYHLAKASTELAPHIVCTYLYELAQTFNRFYESSRVIGDEREATRAQIVKLYADVLKDGLELLGIPALEEM